MKYVIMLLVLIHSVSGATFKVSSNKSESADMSTFMRDISVFIDQPLNWCEVTPEQTYAIDSTYYDDSLIVDIGFKVSCDERIIKQNFKNFIVTHQAFMDTHSNQVDSAINSKYPDLKLYWTDLTHSIGHDINSDTVAYIVMGSDYGASLSNDNKGVFFPLTFNKFTTKPLRATFNGKVLELRGKSIQSAVFFFHVSVPKSEVTNTKELNFDLNHVWHTKKNQSMIPSYREWH